MTQLSIDRSPDKVFKVGFHFCMGALLALSVFAMVGSAISFVLHAPDDCDKGWFSRCDMRVLTDNHTGLQYLSTKHGLSPRMGNDGKQLAVQP